MFSNHEMTLNFGIPIFSIRKIIENCYFFTDRDNSSCWQNIYEIIHITMTSYISIITLNNNSSFFYAIKMFIWSCCFIKWICYFIRARFIVSMAIVSECFAWRNPIARVLHKLLATARFIYPGLIELAQRQPHSLHCIEWTVPDFYSKQKLCRGYTCIRCICTTGRGACDLFIHCPVILKYFSDALFQI